MRRRSSSSMKEHRLLLSPSLLPASPLRASGPDFYHGLLAPAPMQCGDAAAEIPVSDAAKAGRLHHLRQLLLCRESSDRVRQILVSGAVAGNQSAKLGQNVM